MNQSGIDTSEFCAHSTRGASTSKAKAKGLSCQEILAMANWKKESTFRRHYLREIASESAAPFKLLCSKKVSMDFKHMLLYLMEICEVKLGISSVREEHALKL